MFHTEWGDFWLHGQDFVSRDLIGGGFWDSMLLPIFKAHSDPEGVAVDIGAYVGIHSAWLSKHYRDVYAVEAQPYIALVLKKNMAQNGCTNVHVWNAAAYDRWTILKPSTRVEELYKLGPYDEMTSTASVCFEEALYDDELDVSKNVMAVPLDKTQLKGPVRLVKIDAQGCDLKAMKGMEGIIRRDQPGIIFEWEPLPAARLQGGEKLKDYHDFLFSCGYAVRMLVSGHDYYAVPEKELSRMLDPALERSFKGPSFTREELRMFR